jgi:iron complex transport system substrate-binding protein
MRFFQPVLLVLLLLAVAPSRGADGGIIDAGGHTASDYDTSRIVSIGGSITEILYALGVQQKIVAVDTTSLYPSSALREKPNVGYMRQLSPEGVLALSPTLILAIEGSGPKETIDVLERAKIPLISIPDKFTADGIIDKIEIISHDVGAGERGECLIREVRSDLAAVEAMRSQIHRPIKVAFLLSLVGGRPMVSGRDTAADGIIAMAGASNAFDDFAGYKSVNDESLVAAKPDAVLVMQRGEHALSADVVFSEPGLAMTAAAENNNLVSMEGLYLLGFGPRTARAARDLARRLYPNIDVGALPSEQASGRGSCQK